jgi:hypothetical protein
MPRGRPKGSKNKIKATSITRAAPPPQLRPVGDGPQISASALKRAMIESSALLEENGERTQTVNQIKRDAIERGIDPGAYALALKLWRMSRTNAIGFGSFLRGFDRAREALQFDSMVPPDFFEAPVQGRRSGPHLQVADSNGQDDDVEQIMPEAVQHAETMVEEHHSAA